ncbi:MAG TPA: hypothetical protein VN600_04600 [Gemmatimonadaceae bacterium]|nr:hypothetical protein [Gemmatimonadaceae bacterium]
MSDSYIAVIDEAASHADAVRLAPVVVACLAAEGLIVPTLSSDCVLGGTGYPAGPRCVEHYDASARGGKGGGNRFWELATCGVEVHAEPWVNVLGFAQVEGASCPRCEDQLGDEFVDIAGGLVDAFLGDWHPPRITCAACGKESSLHEWRIKPLLGFVHFAVVWWNWPPFGDARWRIDLPGLLQRHTGRSFAMTSGRL